MSPFLTETEIADLCKPLTQPAARVRFLRDKLGLFVRQKPNGHPLVSRVHFEEVMTGNAQARRLQDAARPDTAAVISLLKRKQLDYADGEKEKKQSAGPA